MSRPAVYPTDVSDEEWMFVAPYLCLMKEDAPQREHSLRAVFNALRWMVRAGAPWRLMPTNLPPWQIVHQQSQRWLRAGVFEQITRDLRMLLRLAAGRKEQPTAAVLDTRTLQGSVESGKRGGYDGRKRRKGSKVHLAVDTLGHLLAAHVSAANENERAHVGQLLAAVQETTGDNVEVAYVDQGYNRGGGRRRGPSARRSLRGSQPTSSQEGLRALAPALGGGKVLRLDGALPAAGAGLRTLAGDLSRAALRRLCLPHAHPHSRPKPLVRGIISSGHPLGLRPPR